ncbi:MAG: DegT/DnrJ/EryC1/StrS family aminotransferase [Candidatus Omnitrophota bacterium]|nr:MAG: DegT/DnrJ/EryC1/StrS family aminotransferase [Candidatus Omnitrophota bacterium]
MAKKIKVPFLDLQREYIFLKKDIEKKLKTCLKEQRWILGAKVEQFEKEAANFLGAKYTIGVASGTDALILALRGLAIQRRQKEYFDSKDEIITTPFSFVATAEAIIRAGATPVFVDIDSHTFNIDPEAIKKAITENTVGILPVHLYGLAADMTKILKVAQEHNLFIVEDVAQAFGGLYQGKKLGTFGSAGAFSFYPSKNLGGYGDGGLIATDSNELMEKIKILRDHGQKTQYNAEYIGYNSRLDAIQAAILSVKLRYVNRFNSLKRKIAQKYARSLRSIQQIHLPYEPQYCLHTYNLYTIKVAHRRSELLQFLHQHGVGARIYYPLPLHKMKAFGCARTQGRLSATEVVASRALSLPIYSFLKETEIHYIAKIINNFFRHHPSNT